MVRPSPPAYPARVQHWSSSFTIAEDFFLASAAFAAQICDPASYYGVDHGGLVSVLTEKTAGSAHAITGTAEATTLPEQFVDLIIFTDSTSLPIAHPAGRSLTRNGWWDLTVVLRRKDT